MGWSGKAAPHTEETLCSALDIPSCSPTLLYVWHLVPSLHPWSLSQNDVAVNSLGWIILCCRSYPGQCKVFGGILDLDPWDTSSTPQILTVKKNVSRHCSVLPRGEKLHLLP